MASACYDLGLLTDGELVYLWRQSLIAPAPQAWRTAGRAGSYGISQKIAAKRLGVAFPVYWRVELGRASSREVALVRERIIGTGFIWPPQPSTGELCAIARRRAVLTLPEAAERTGVSRPHYLRCEAAGDTRVIGMFQRLGYKF
jgi:hypothetical protein